MKFEDKAKNLMVRIKNKETKEEGWINLSELMYKIGMGVNVSGNLNQDNIRELAKIHLLEDLIVANALIVKALAIGFEHAVRDFVNII